MPVPTVLVSMNGNVLLRDQLHRAFCRCLRIVLVVTERDVDGPSVDAASLIDLLQARLHAAPQLDTETGIRPAKSGRLSEEYRGRCHALSRGFGGGDACQHHDNANRCLRHAGTVSETGRRSRSSPLSLTRRQSLTLDDVRDVGAGAVAHHRYGTGWVANGAFEEWIHDRHVHLRHDEVIASRF